MAQFFAKYKSYIFFVIIVILTLGVFLPQLENLKEGLEAVRSADPAWVIAGLILFMLGMPIMAAQFYVLAFKPLNYLMTLKVEMATMFVNKLLPIGMGTLSLNAFYLTKRKHTSMEAFTVVATHSAMSFVAYLIIIIVALASSTTTLKSLARSINAPVDLIAVIGLMIVLVVFLLWRSERVRSRVKSVASSMKQNLGHYRHRPMALFLAVAFNVASSMTSVLALYGSAKAIDVRLSIGGAVLAYTFGNLAAALVPTPGGIGATEAGVYAGLLLAGIDDANALVITLIYRVITYWIPTIPGYIFFYGLRKNLLAGYSIRKQSAPSPVTIV